MQDTHAEPINTHAVSLYEQSDAMDDFPVLKAFQQYIDAEQMKARRRLLSLGIFFSLLMGAVIAVFVLLLINISQRNQALNDRLIEYAMKDRDRPAASAAPVVVQPPVQQDNAAILSLTTKLEDLHKKLQESQKKADEAERAQKEAAAAAAEAMKPKEPTPQELEIQRLKALLSAEKEKLAAEKAKQREAELEAYRRKHYPELYEQPKPKVAEQVPQPPSSVSQSENANRRQRKVDVDNDILDEINEIVNDRKTRLYFDDSDEVPTQLKAKNSLPTELPVEKKLTPVQTQNSAPEEKQSYVIPVEVKGKSSTWRLP